MNISGKIDKEFQKKFWEKSLDYLLEVFLREISVSNHKTALNEYFEGIPKKSSVEYQEKFLKILLGKLLVEFLDKSWKFQQVFLVEFLTDFLSKSCRSPQENHWNKSRRKIGVIIFKVHT